MVGTARCGWRTKNCRLLSALFKSSAFRYIGVNEAPLSVRCSLLRIFHSLLPASRRSFPELLQSDLARARTFVIGPWEAYIRPGLPYYYGPAAQEWELRKLLQAPDAASRMRWVLSHGTPEGQMYALYGLRQLNDPEFESIARRLQDRPGEILTTSMVIGFHKTRQEVIERIRENNFHS